MKNAIVRILLSVLLPIAIGSGAFAGDEVSFDVQTDSVAIDVGGKPLATYVFRDAKILRPYLVHVRAPSGVQVTRNHPPVEGADRTDHDTMHPGIWLAFGDISGVDFCATRGASNTSISSSSRPRTPMAVILLFATATWPASG